MTEEDHIQIACAEYMDAKYPGVPWWHVPNGGKREKKSYKDKHGITHWYCPEGKKLKDMGVKPNVPDITIATARRGYHGFYCELKTKTGTVRKGQREMLQTLAKEGYYCCACFSVDEFMERADWYLGKVA